jgi:hypothetical protein
MWYPYSEGNDRMPIVFRKGRYRFFFFSNEGHEPMHIHVESDDRHAKFWLEPVGLANSVGYRAHELNEIRQLALAHAALCNRRWHEHFGE